MGITLLVTAVSKQVFIPNLVLPENLLGGLLGSQMLIRPKAVQSPMMTSGFGTSPAIVDGVRKIPLPIVMPTISAVPPANPMTRRRSCAGWERRTVVEINELAAPRGTEGRPD